MAKISPKALRTIIFSVAVAIVVISGYVLIVANLPVSTPSSQANNITIKSAGDAITWPNYGQSAIGVAGVGVLQTNGTQTAHPIASIAKLMDAFLTLQKKPLQLNETGPTITITQADVDLYSSYLSQNGSVVPVNVGEKLTEYQMLQALLLPSGDNIADTLAIWSYGSVDSYLAAANQEATKLGMVQTHFADSSGLSPQTVSSAQDLILLGDQIMANPVLAQIVGQSKVTLPVAGVEYNVDSLLGQDGIVGIKTGNTDEAGGCFLFATSQTIGGKATTVIGAILGATDLQTVLASTTSLLQNNTTAVSLVPVVTAGQTVGTYTTAWGQTITAVAKSDLSIYVAGDQSVAVDVTLNKLSGPTTTDVTIGQVTTKSGQSTLTVPVILSSSITKPRLSWHLLHP